jgi:hypothetical protein
LTIADCHRKPRTKLAYPQTDWGDGGTPVVTTTATATATATSTSVIIAGGPTVVSDADRAAARDLFNDGVQLQKDAKYNDALDRFSRSYSVFAAPTTALRIAQCKVSLGKLLEGAEGYRALANMQIPPNSPPAFFEAQKTASTELSAVDPRIPRAKINVTPANVPGLTVTVDGQPMNVALVGASRPVDPGSHKVVANAPGYWQVEMAFEIKEKETKDVAVPMKKR